HAPVRVLAEVLGRTLLALREVDEDELALGAEVDRRHDGAAGVRGHRVVIEAHGGSPCWRRRPYETALTALCQLWKMAHGPVRAAGRAARRSRAARGG